MFSLLSPAKEKGKKKSLEEFICAESYFHIAGIFCSQCRLGVEALAPRLGGSGGRSGQYCTENCILGRALQGAAGFRLQ